MTKTIIGHAYSKINLFLEVTAKRADGYHELDSIMQTTTLADEVTVTVTDSESTAVTLESSDPSLPTDLHNLACKAAMLYVSAFGITAHIHIKINKVIPVASGLAGGSADAAAVLALLERIYEKAGSIDALSRLSKPLGADVPFCVRCGIARTRGIGEIMTDCPSLTGCRYVIACGEGRKSTAAAYGEIDLLPSRKVRTADGMIVAIADGDTDAVGREMYNIFERVTEYPHEIKDVMLSCGASAALMSGSGPSVFGIFREAEDADRAKAELSSMGYAAFTAEPAPERKLR